MIGWWVMVRSMHRSALRVEHPVDEYSREGIGIFGCIVGGPHQRLSRTRGCCIELGKSGLGLPGMVDP